MATKAKSKEWPGAFATFDKSFKLITANPRPVLLFIGVYTVLSIISLVIQGRTSYSEKGYVSYADALYVLFVLPITIYALAMADKKKLSVSEFMQIDFKKLLMLIVTSLLATVLVVLSIVALIFPVIWVGAWFALVVFPVAEKGMSPIAALKESKRLTEHHRGIVWRMIGVMILVSVMLAVIGGIPYIGAAAVAFSSVWTSVSLAHLYRWLQTQN